MWRSGVWPREHSSLLLGGPESTASRRYDIYVPEIDGVAFKRLSRTHTRNSFIQAASRSACSRGPLCAESQSRKYSILHNLDIIERLRETNFVLPASHFMFYGPSHISQQVHRPWSLNGEIYFLQSQLNRRPKALDWTGTAGNCVCLAKWWVIFIVSSSSLTGSKS